MKKYISIKLLVGLFLCMVLSSTNAQQALDKNQTILYIRDKISQTVGNQIIPSQGKINFMHTMQFYTAGNQVILDYQNGLYNYVKLKADNRWCHNFYSFDPAQIIDVVAEATFTASNSPIGYIKLVFASNSVKTEKLEYYHYSPGVYIVDYNSWKYDVLEVGNIRNVLIPYLMQDPSSFERLKKAFLHLKKLSVVIDPFDN